MLVGVPPLSAPPREKGLGSFLIAQTLRYELAGVVELDYAREGLAARLRAKPGSFAPSPQTGAMNRA